MKKNASQKMIKSHYRLRTKLVTEYKYVISVSRPEKDATLMFFFSTAVCCPGFSFTVTLRKPLELSGPWWDKTSLSESNEPTR